MNDMASRIEALQAAGWRQRTLPGFAQRFGPLWTRREGDAWAYGVLATAEHLNPAGRVHGGALCSLLDHALSTVAWEAAGRRPCVTVQLSTQFLAAAGEGQFLEARAQVTRMTSSLVFMHGSVTAGAVELLQGSGVLKQMPA